MTVIQTASRLMRGWTSAFNARGTITVTVAPEFESLTVKAGSFKVVKMVSDNVYRGSMKAEGDKRFGSWDSSVRVVSYYAPEIGIWVKSESTEKHEYGEVSWIASNSSNTRPATDLARGR